MSDENLHIKATFTASNRLSPVLHQIIGDIKKLQSEARKLNATFSGMGNAGIRAMTSFDAATKAAVAQARGLGNTNSRVARDVSQHWRRANDQRLQDSRRLYSSLEAMERSYQRQIERRVAAERRAERAASRSASRGVDVGRGAGIGRGGHIPRPSGRTLLYGGLIAGGGVAAALKQRMAVQLSEVKADTYADLSQAEIKKLRADYANSAGLKYGVGVKAAIDASVETLKAGAPSKYAAQLGELVLQAQTGLETDTATTAKLLGRLATLRNDFDSKKLYSAMNAIGVASASTAADPSETVEAYRRSLSAMVATKISAEDLAAFDASAVSIGLMPSKAGTAISFMFSELANAKNARGQRAKDIAGGASALGFAGRSDLAQQMVANPTQTMLTIFKRLMAMPEDQRAKVANQLFMREYRDEAMALAAAHTTIRKTLDEIGKSPNFLKQASLKKINSLAGNWATVQATFGLVAERVGAGFESTARELATGIMDVSGNFDWDTIKAHVESFMAGLRRGMGFDTWADLIKRVASYFDAGTVAKWTSFGKGFGEGLLNVISIVKTAFKGLAFLTGNNIDDAKGAGKFVAYLGALTVALALLPLGILGGLAVVLHGLAMSPIGRLVIGLGSLAVIIHRLLSYVSDKIFSVFTSIVDAIKNVAVKTINWFRSIVGLGPINSGSHGASGSWSNTPATKSGSGASDNRGASGSWGNTSASKSSAGASGGWNASPANAVRSSFNGTVDAVRSAAGISGSGSISSAAYDKMFADTPLAGRQAEIEAAAKANGIPPALLASVIAHETGKGRNVNYNNVAGVMDSETGFSRKKGFASLSDGISAAGRIVAKNYRRAGGDIGKMGGIYAPVGAANDPNGLNAAWPKAVSGYQSRLAGDVASQITGANPADFAMSHVGKNEYGNRAELTQLLHHDVAGRINAWCARYTNWALGQAGIKGTGSAVANDFQRWGKGVSLNQVQRGDVLVQPNGRGPGQTGGHVGMATGNTRMVGDRLQVEMVSGNDGDQVRTSWRNADKLMARRAIQSVPSPADAVASVPTSNSAMSSGLLQRHGDAALRSGSGGNHIFHIHGVTDPETVATAVQRRIEESANYAMRDRNAEIV